jgi:hypothetical protein
MKILIIENLIKSFNSVQQGLRAVIFYTYDDSFTGSDIFVQELKAANYEKVSTLKEFVTKPKPLSSAYEFLEFLDGRCDFQVKCEKQIIQPPKPLSCPAKEVCPVCPKQQECGKTTTTTTRAPTPKSIETTYRQTGTPAPTTRSTTTTTTPRPTTLKQVPLKLCKNSAPDSSYPDCCENGGKGKFLEKVKVILTEKLNLNWKKCEKIKKILKQWGNSLEKEAINVKNFKMLKKM